MKRIISGSLLIICLVFNARAQKLVLATYIERTIAGPQLGAASHYQIRKNLNAGVFYQSKIDFNRDIQVEPQTFYGLLLQMSLIRTSRLNFVASLRSNKNVRFPYHFQNGEFVFPVIPVPASLSDYDSDFGNFLKYTFVQYDTCKAMALEMYQTIDKGKYERHRGYYAKDDQIALNSFIIEFPIRQFDIFRDDTLGYNSIHLQNFLSLPDSMAAETLKDKIVVVGDFLESDMHQTIYGTTAGPLIHLDAYLNLKENRNALSGWFFLYLFVFYFIFSYVLFFNSSIFTFGWATRIQKSKVGGFLFDYLKYAFFLLLMSVVSFLLFGVHLNVLIISLYFSLIEYGIEFVKTRLIKNKQTA